ncbi:MAG: 6-carboxytetrahydropterin synthase [Bdellovibrio sp.]
MDIISWGCHIRFSCAHFYRLDHWSEQRNRSEFGLCYSKAGHGHGHDYDLEIELELRSNSDQDLSYLQSQALEKLSQLRELLDHRHLNLDFDFFKSKLPTTENLALFCWDQLKVLPLRRLRLFEREDLWVDLHEMPTGPKNNP